MSEQKDNQATLTMADIRTAVLRAAILLGLFTLLGSLLIALTHQNTEEKIENNKRDFILKNLDEVLPRTVNSQSFYDNDILADSYTLDNGGLGPNLGPDLGQNSGKDGIIIYPAFKDNEPVGAIITSIATNGYNGRIKVLVGIKDNNGKAEIISSRVVEHKETPGLGDPIEAKRSDWIYQYDGKSLTNPDSEQWLVKKDGGDFDQLTGATITPRAVTQAIKQALLYYEANRNTLFNQNNRTMTDTNK